MKKIYTIGRDEGCDIVIHDSTDVISRLHATIRVESNNKIYLTDQSRNGTYINGMKMSSNVEIPVSRKDVVSLAHIYELDWSLVPKQKSKTKIFFLVILLVTLLGGATYFFFCCLNHGDSNEPVNEQAPKPPVIMKPDTVPARDTVPVKLEKERPIATKPEEVEQEEERVEETVEKPKEEIYNPIY